MEVDKARLERIFHAQARGAAESIVFVERDCEIIEDRDFP